MKAIKLWKIDFGEVGKPSVSAVESSEKTETETQLENLLTCCPDLLIEGLTIIGRQTETPGGPLDLLGVDPDGRLVVFELKRGTLSRDAVAQIIDYASYLSELNQDELSKHISTRSGSLNIEKMPEFTGHKPRMILVGLGADDRTRRMVSFLADSDIDISLITFHAFKHNGEVFFAKQVEVEAPPPPPGRITKQDNLRKLRENATRSRVDTFYHTIAEFFRNQIPGYEWPNPSGYSYSLPEVTSTGSPTTAVYASLYIAEAQVEIRILPRAVEAASPYLTEFQKGIGSRMALKSDGGAGILVKSLDEWKQILPAFEEFLPKVIEGWKKKRQQKAAQEFDEADRHQGEGELFEPVGISPGAVAE
ncbi:MAG: endonuclease NucS domain-containing protein [Syntrophobacteraceae bacterium]